MNLINEIENKNELKGKVISSKYISSLKEECLIILRGKGKLIMPKSEIDIEKNWDDIDGFIGRELHFLPIKTEGQMTIVSRKELQKEKRESVIERLKNGETFKGKVINTLKYAAYIEIEGVLTGLLKNTDFSDSHISIKEAVKKGAFIDVKLKNYTENKIILIATNKFTPDRKAFLSKKSEEDVVTGVIKTLLPDKCFVNISPGIDGLANVPAFEIDEGMKVDFKITKIDLENERVRGKILNLKF